MLLLPAHIIIGHLQTLFRFQKWLKKTIVTQSCVISDAWIWYLKTKFLGLEIVRKISL